MRATEFLSEAQARLMLRDFTIIVSEHALDQCRARGVNAKSVDTILRNLSKIKSVLLSIEENREFILHDGKKTALGMRKKEGKNLLLGTVYNIPPGFTKGKHPTFFVDTTSTELTESTLDEGWKEKLGAAAIGSALTLGGLGVKQYLNQQPEPQQPTQYTQQTKQPTKAELLKQVAQQVGMEGNELAQFMSQAAHETLNFHTLAEIGSSRYFAKKYDPKFNPRKAKILGNTQVGDGEKYKGRGYLQITGRYNYAQAGKALGLPLEDRPELLERPDIAAKAAVWYWNSRVKPKVTDFSNVKQATKKINPGMKGLKDRENKFKQYTQGAK